MTPSRDVQTFQTSRQTLDAGAVGNTQTSQTFQTLGVSEGKTGNTQVSTHTEANRSPWLVKAADVQKKAPRFLDNPMLPVGVLTLIAGRAGVSKSTLSLYRAALATKGQLEGDWKGEPVNVAVSGIEDNDSMQRMRLEAEDADLDRVFFLSMSDKGADTGVRLPDDIDTIKGVFVQNDIRLWIIDPITSAMSGDTNKRDDVRAALDPLAKMAQELDISILGILHFNKGGGYASDKISGSHAFRDAVRSLLLVARDDNNGDCIVTIDKSSYTQAQGTSYSYGLISHDVTDDDGHVFGVPKITGFMPTERNVNEVINSNVSVTGQDQERASGNEVIDWLVEYLSRNGPTRFADIEKAAEAEGYEKKQLSNARQRSKAPWVVSVPDPDWKGKGVRRVWSVSEIDPSSEKFSPPIASGEK
ncbi:carboxylate--amine ligase [Bifidobacterium scaligerum]|uniref:Carboxylate--amine ligase n=2 Tax=Bifidobacterium scaligerum TaxID=2052656 RepID=A0A2M9HQK6_9BIFI|nr:carboxylate--amine ligase [Bifidobacterium scaligerum]